jgi:hypothetical protein
MGEDILGGRGEFTPFFTQSCRRSRVFSELPLFNEFSEVRNA